MSGFTTKIWAIIILPIQRSNENGFNFIITFCCQEQDVQELSDIIIHVGTLEKMLVTVTRRKSCEKYCSTRWRIIISDNSLNCQTIKHLTPADKVYLMINKATIPIGSGIVKPRMPLSSLNYSTRVNSLVSIYEPSLRWIRRVFCLQRKTWLEKPLSLS